MCQSIVYIRRCVIKAYNYILICTSNVQSIDSIELNRNIIDPCLRKIDRDMLFNMARFVVEHTKFIKSVV